MSDQTKFDYFLSAILLTMLGLVWMLLQETYSLLMGNEQEAEQKNEGLTEEQSHPPKQMLMSSIEDIQSLSLDYKYINCKIPKVFRRSRKQNNTTFHLPAADGIKNILGACHLKDKNYLSTNILNFKVMAVTITNSPRAITVPVCSTLSTMNENNLSRIKPLPDFQDHIILIKMLLLSNRITQEEQFNATIYKQTYNTQIINNSIFKDEIKLNKTQLRNLQIMAHFIVNFLLNKTVDPVLSYKIETHQSGPLSTTLNGYDTLFANTNKVGRLWFTYKQQTQRIFSNLTLNEMENTSEVMLINRTLANIINYKEDSYLIKHAKRKYRRRQKRKAAFPSEDYIGQLTCLMATNEGYSRSTLLMEIHRQLKPIKDKIIELRQSMTVYSVKDEMYRNKRVNPNYLLIQTFEKANHTRNIPLTYSYTNVEKCGHQQEIFKVYSCMSDKNLFITEGKPKKLSPLAEMYIKLIKNKNS